MPSWTPPALSPFLPLLPGSKSYPLLSLNLNVFFLFSLFILTDFLSHLIPFLCKSFCSQLFIVKSSKLYLSFLLDFEIAAFHHIHTVLMVEEHILKTEYIETT